MMPMDGRMRSGRSAHRRSLPWLSSMAAACRQVWNKQRKDEILIDVDDVAIGTRPRCAGMTSTQLTG
jgi:hypothetical protein